LGHACEKKTAQRHIISYHDECCCHASDYEKRRWSVVEFDRRENPVAGEPVVVCVDVYDNSSGHNCKAKDGLDVGKLNLSPGGAAKEALVIRDGTYLCPLRGRVSQPMFFSVGEVLLVEVKTGQKIRPRSTLEAGKTTRTYPVGHIIDGDSELLEVQKGIKQVLLERKVGFGGGGCLQEKHVKTAAAHNKGVIAAWEVDRENAGLIQQLLTLRPAAVVAVEARLLPCSCARCTPSSTRN